MTITVGIVGHWARRERVQSLAQEVSADIVSIDEGSLGHLLNHMLVWKELAYFVSPSTLSWAVCLEDDAVPIAKFRDELHRALFAAPSGVVSLYLGRSRPPHWQHAISSVIARPECWLMAEEMLHGVAIAVRGDLVMPMVQGLRDLANEQRLPIDELIGKWCRRHEIQIAYSHPSLVDHADGPSVITEHTSQHPTDSETREQTGPRRAWVLGSRIWDNTTATIPTPGAVSSLPSVPNS